MSIGPTNEKDSHHSTLSREEKKIVCYRIATGFSNATLDSSRQKKCLPNSEEK